MATLPLQMKPPGPISKNSIFILSLFIALLATAAGYYMIYVQVQNNTIPSLRLLVLASPPQLPGAIPHQLLETRFTHIKPIDDALVNLVSFYWWAADGGYPGVSLFGIWMVGQLLLPLSVLLILEGWRAGNGRSVIAFSTTWQLLWQFIPWALVLSIYTIITIITINISPLIHTTTIPLLASHLSIPSAQLRALPWSLAVGLLFPTVLVMAPSPTVTSYSLHQYILAYWQFYPLYIYFLQFTFTRLFSPSTRHTTDHATVTATNSGLSPLRTVYVFTLAVSTMTHITTLTLSVSSVLFPVLFASGLAAEFHPSHIFLPLSPFAPAKVVTLARGCLNLLQWDSLFVSILGLFLAGMAYRRTYASNGLVGDIVKTIGLSVLVGPGSTALLILWKRDELVLGARLEKLVKKL